MPIVNELKSINRLEQAGFSHEQAKAIVEVAEDGAQRGFERFTEVLHTSMAELRSELRLDMQTLRADLLKDQRDQMLRFAALVALVTGLIGAVLKFL